MRLPLPRWSWARTIALGLTVLSFALLLAAQRDVGIARDEVVYINHGRVYARWWMDLVERKGVANAKKIDAAFGADKVESGNGEHPPLMKTLFGLSEKLLHEELGWTSELTGFRAPTALLGALLVLLVFGFTREVWGVPEATIAALLTLLLPRLFFHAGLACFDAPIATLWFATVVAYWKALSSRWWCLGLGVVFGLALATKHNAIILPSVVLAHYAWVALWSRRLEWGAARDAARAGGGGAGAGAGAGGGRGGRGRRGGAGARLAVVLRMVWPTIREAAIGFRTRRPLALIAMVVVGPATLFALWPRLWIHPGHVWKWIGFHLHHVHYNFEYLGDNWNAPPFPWHVAVVTTLVTVPVVTLLGGAIGAGVLAARARRREAADPERAPGLLLLLSMGASMGPFFLGATPIFGAEKHWAPAIPSICIAAGVGAVWAARRLGAWLSDRAVWTRPRRRALEVAAIVAVGGLMVTAAAVETEESHPYGLSSYNALAGGAPGGADLGMNRQFWGVAAKGVIPWLQTQPRGKVYSHDASPAWDLYIKYGELSSGYPEVHKLEAPGIHASDYALVIHEKHFNRHDYLVWQDYGTVQPAFVLRADGVPIVSVYARAKAPAAKPKPRTPATAAPGP
ncbi:MAG: glycosyltransferase family 39 protein [Kofleriaceae bacterium]|nr:glycosyltransferase family 39 protein [Kofleriaceae bacterium]